MARPAGFEYPACMDKLQVFISWSGDRAHSVAKVIKEWLPDVVRNAEPWLSSEDLQKGSPWLPELNKILSTTGFGLIVLTAENKNAPWLLFEAGVISKALPDKHCCPLLCDLKPTDVSGPLAQFQGTTLTVKDDMMKLVKTMNHACGPAKADDDRLEKWFNTAWDEFAKKTGDIITAKTTTPSVAAKAGPTDRELLEEILLTTRRLTIEPRSRKEEWIEEWTAKRLDAPLSMQPETVFDEYSKWQPSVQRKFLEMLPGGRGEMAGEAMTPQMRKFLRFIRRDSDYTTEDSNKPTK
jgi:hypothetical protein